MSLFSGFSGFWPVFDPFLTGFWLYTPWSPPKIGHFSRFFGSGPTFDHFLTPFGTGFWLYTPCSGLKTRRFSRFFRSGPCGNPDFWENLKIEKKSLVIAAHFFDFSTFPWFDRENVTFFPDFPVFDHFPTLFLRKIGTKPLKNPSFLPSDRSDLENRHFGTPKIVIFGPRKSRKSWKSVKNHFLGVADFLNADSSQNPELFKKVPARPRGYFQTRVHIAENASKNRVFYEKVVIFLTHFSKKEAESQLFFFHAKMFKIWKYPFEPERHTKSGQNLGFGTPKNRLKIVKNRSKIPGHSPWKRFWTFFFKKKTSGDLVKMTVF